MSEQREWYPLTKGEQKKLLFVSFDRGSNGMLELILSKFCTQVFWQKFLIEFVDGPNYFNRSKMAAILNTLLKEKYILKGLLLLKNNQKALVKAHTWH